MKKLYVALGFVCFLLFFRFNSVEVSINAHVYGTPANGTFDDDNFYTCIIDTYNKDNRSSLGYDVGFSSGEIVVFRYDSYRPGYRLAGWRYNNNDYRFGEILFMPDNDIELEPICEADIPDYY